MCFKWKCRNGLLKALNGTWGNKDKPLCWALPSKISKVHPEMQSAFCPTAFLGNLCLSCTAFAVSFPCRLNLLWATLYAQVLCQRCLLDRTLLSRVPDSQPCPQPASPLGWAARLLISIFLTFLLTSLHLIQLEDIFLKCRWPGLYAVFQMVSPGPHTKTWMLRSFFWKYFLCYVLSYLLKERNWVSLARSTFSKPILHFTPYCFYLCIINYTPHRMLMKA